MLSTAEKQLFHTLVDDLADKPEKAEVAFKVFYNLLKKTTPASIEISATVLDRLQTHKLNVSDLGILKDSLKNLFILISKIASEETDFGKQYSTGQLAKYFGVSITTINRWIDMGKFINYVREERNKQARISENIFWESPNGEKILVKDIVEQYELKHRLNDQEHLNSKVDRIRYIVDMINFYEERYGKKYQDIALEKGDPSTSEDWQWAREGKEWRYLLTEISDL